MLRLAHRILTMPLTAFPDDSTSRDRFSWFRSSIESGPAIILDDENLEECSGQLLRNFVIKAPFDNVFIEWNCDRRANTPFLQRGVLCTSVKQGCKLLLGDAPDLIDVDANYAYECSMFVTQSTGGPVAMPFSTLILTDDGNRFKDFCLLRHNERAEAVSEDSVCLHWMQNVIAALALVNARGVIIENATEADGVPTEKWIRRLKTKSIVYKVLNLTGHPRSERHKHTLHSEDGLDGKKRHIVRGNFATYTPEKPHVSGYVGNMWRAAHMRGDDKHGVVVKDYKLT